MVQLNCSVASLVASATAIRDKCVPWACTRDRKPVECHSNPSYCSKAGLLKTQKKPSQRTSPICPPPSASLRDMPFHTLAKIKLSKVKALCDWARLATGNHWPRGVWVNYKIVSLGTALVLLCSLSSWTAVRVIYSPGRSAYRAQSCCRGSLNHHISSLSSSAPCELSFRSVSFRRLNRGLTAKFPFLTPRK